jgi:hypothetical protein
LSALFHKTILVGCDFVGARLILTEFQLARLDQCDFTDADLIYANFEGAFFPSAILDPRRLENIHWSAAGGSTQEQYVRPEELKAQTENDDDAKGFWWQTAESVYRSLKRAHQNAGIYDVADQFAYREQIVITKRLWHAKSLRNWTGIKTLIAALIRYIFADELLGFGYGYRPWRVWRTGTIVFAFFLAFYSLLGLYPSHVFWQWGPFQVPDAVGFGKCIYFSAVSFTAVGYGAWVSASGNELNWTRYLGAVESVVGVFLMALFLVTFTRQYLR